jgi:hypothetical protein
MKTIVIATSLIALVGTGLAVVQQGLDNKSEGAAPAPPALQNAPPGKITPQPSTSPNTPPDAKAESNQPWLKLDSGAEKKLPALGAKPTEQTPPRQ